MCFENSTNRNYIWGIKISIQFLFPFFLPTKGNLGNAKTFLVYERPYDAWLVRTGVHLISLQQFVLLLNFIVIVLIVYSDIPLFKGYISIGISLDSYMYINYEELRIIYGSFQNITRSWYLQCNKFKYRNLFSGLACP